MPRIKVTGFINTEELPVEFLDSNHVMGLSNVGYETLQPNVQVFTGDEVVPIVDAEFQHIEDI
jgi:hypothetical protein